MEEEECKFGRKWEKWSVTPNYCGEDREASTARICMVKIQKYARNEDTKQRGVRFSRGMMKNWVHKESMRREGELELDEE